MEQKKYSNNLYYYKNNELPEYDFKKGKVFITKEKIIEVEKIFQRSLNGILDWYIGEEWDIQLLENILTNHDIYWSDKHVNILNRFYYNDYDLLVQNLDIFWNRANKIIKKERFRYDDCFLNFIYHSINSFHIQARTDGWILNAGEEFLFYDRHFYTFIEILKRVPELEGLRFFNIMTVNLLNDNYMIFYYPKKSLFKKYRGKYFQRGNNGKPIDFLIKELEEIGIENKKKPQRLFYHNTYEQFY